MLMFFSLCVSPWDTYISNGVSEPLWRIIRVRFEIPGSAPLGFPSLSSDREEKALTLRHKVTISLALPLPRRSRNRSTTEADGRTYPRILATSRLSSVSVLRGVIANPARCSRAHEETASRGQAPACAGTGLWGEQSRLWEETPSRVIASVHALGTGSSLSL